MKRMIPMLLVLALLLCACGGKPEETSAPSAEDPVPQTSANDVTDTTDATDTPATDETTVPATDPEPAARNPLNGAALESVWTGRAMAVVINNHHEAMPQYGVSQADILYEFETEGGVTRRLGIFSDVTKVATVGPIRSARSYFINVATSYGAPLAHCGGSEYALAAKYDINGNTISKWEHIDEMYNGAYFFRDTARQSQGYAYEHTLFTSGEKLGKALAARNYNMVIAEGVDYGLQFAETPALDGEKAEQINIKFLGEKTTTATYNKETGRYEIAQYGEVGVDANNGEKLASRNVLVIYAQQSKKGIHSFYDLIGTGEGLFACDGKIVPIVWTRNSVEDTFAYTLKDGTPITLGVGNSYVAIVSEKSPATYGG